MPLKSNADLMRALLGGHWSPCVPFNPAPKQLAFCALPHVEALYGGASGGGKSAVLLMDALRHMEVPGYAAIIFRRNLTDLKRNGGLLDLAYKWLGPYIGSEIYYEASTHMFRWMNGSSLTFGYVGSYTAWEHYQGGNYQYIGWDELTQHSEQDYDEMLTRLRKNTCATHGEKRNKNCRTCELYQYCDMIPLKVRATTNPGGRGHLWVKKRFQLKKTFDEGVINPVTKQSGIWLSGDPSRPYLPAFFIDNPGLDHESYQKILKMIKDDQRKAQMLEGDWDWIANGLFHPEWFKPRYQYKGGYYIVKGPSGAGLYSFHEQKLRIFTVVDVACSLRTGIGDRSFRQSQGGSVPASWTVVGTFGITPRNELLVLDVRRFQEEAPQIFDAMKDVCLKWRPMYVCIEVNGPGKPIAQLATQMGVAVKEAITYSDKISNAAEATVRTKSGKVLLPEEDVKPWTNDFIGELSTWTGHPHEPDDQVDVLSNAVHEFTRLSGSLDRQGIEILHKRDLPYISPKHGRIFDMPNMYGM